MEHLEQLELSNGKNKLIVLGNIMDETNRTLSAGRVYMRGGSAPTIGASHFGYERYVLEMRETVQDNNKWVWNIDGCDYLIRIRKLTPLECFRVMDFDDDAFLRASEVNSNTQLYKQAGNSIVKNVLVACLGQLFTTKENVYRDKFSKNINYPE